MILIPVVPIILDNFFETDKIRYVDMMQMNIARINRIFSIKDDVFSDKIITDVIAPGPAMRGMPKGV